MRNRDEFPPAVRRDLAARAGHKCSLPWCEKATSGPGARPGEVLSDGIAAHITAASSDGPRYDGRLSSVQRSSAENGIWVCTQHGREIDSDSSSFTVDLLRGLKRHREEMAKRELESRSNVEDRSAILVDLPHAHTALQLFEIISPQPYTFSTTSATRNLLREAERPSQILDLASEVIIATWDTHPNVAGILATLLSTNIETWQPSRTQMTKLRTLCAKAINSDEWAKVAAVEPLAFAISGKGFTTVHRKVLERLVNAAHWRDADAARIREYYGTVGNEIAALFRHWNDEFRGGLLKANDVARVIDVLLSNDQIFRTGSQRPLVDLLESHAVVLRDSGETELARVVVEFVEAFRTPRQPRS